jgi:hypothetical protein
MSTFSCVVLPCIGTGLAMGPITSPMSPNKMSQNDSQFHNLILNRNRSGGVISETYDNV